MKETQCSIAHIILEYRARCKKLGLNRIITTDILYFPLEIEKLSQLDKVYVRSEPLDDSLRLRVIMIANKGMKQNKIAAQTSVSYGTICQILKRSSILNDSNVQSLNGVDVSSISRPPNPSVETMEIDLDETEAPNSPDDRLGSAKNTSGQRPSSTLRFPIPPDQREQMLSDRRSKTVSTSVISEPYSALPTKRWPYVVTINSNPIIPKQAMYDAPYNFLDSPVQ
ncbi:hypothetical protein ACOME3_007547 [Neoechinorhynchus agilis]